VAVRSPALLVASILAALLLGAPEPKPRLTSSRPAEQRELSWEAVVLDSIAHDSRFGVDVIYTFGPLAEVYIDQFHPALWRRAFLAKLAVLILLGTQAWFLTVHAPGRLWRRGLACAALVLPASQMNNDMVPDGLFISLAVVAQLAYVARPTTVTYAVSAVVCAYLSLAKFSLVPLFGTALLSPLIVEPSWRRGLALAAVGPLALPLLWLISGQQIADLPSFVGGSLAQAGGYGQAMSYEHAIMRPQLVLAVPLTLAVVWFGASIGIGGTSRRRAASILILAASGFLAFKSGFTRHDVHVWIPYVWFASVGVAAGLLSRTTVPVVTAYAVLFVAFAVHVEATVGGPYAVGLANAKRQLHRISTAYITPGRTLAEARARYVEELDRIRALPLSALVRRWQPADVDASNQIPALIDRSVRPLLRPAFQSPAAYSRALAAVNRRYLENLPAGSHIIIELWAFDDRYPGLQQSGAWDLLLRQFEVVEFARPFTVLRKHRKAGSTCHVDLVEGRMNEFVNLPTPVAGAVVIAAPVAELTVWGRLRGFVFRDAAVVIETITGAAGARTEEDRYVVQMGAQGFVLQPSIRLSDELPTLWQPVVAREPLRVRIKAVERLRSYRSGLEWRLQTCRSE
jgi:hypothetical protein